MAMKGLYPPIVKTYMPAFKIPSRGESIECAVDYQLSPLNADNEIKYVQMTIVNQANNQSALNIKTYPNGIKMQTFGGNKIKFTVGSSGDIDAITGQIYKVQIRFVSNSVTAPSNIKSPDAVWLNKNLDYFSEWSTVCLITFIDQPIITLNSFDRDVQQNQTKYTIVETSPNIFLTASFNCENDTLKSYNVALYDGTELLEKSENKFESSINYTFNTEVSNDKNYEIQISYTTKKLFSEVLKYKIKTNTGENSNTLCYSKIISYINQDEDQMIIKCDINNIDKNSFTNGTLLIRRTSHLSNFKKWEIVHRANLAPLTKTYFWTDNTVDSGVWYRYGLCFEFNKSGSIRTSAMVKEDEPSMIILNGASLVGGGRMLKIYYDQKVSLTNKTSSSVTETIGGRYPIIRTNGNLRYKQLTISGLITRHMDSNELFISKDEVYNSNTKMFEDYNKLYRVTEYNDLNYEKLFREEVLKFLLDGKPKLFRSATEGSILVKLTDVTLTPNDQLGRMIYSFSATAYEVDDTTLENYDKYDIQNIQNDEYEVLSVRYKTNPDGSIKIELVEQTTDMDGYGTINSSAFINGSGNYVLILDKKMK